MNVTKSSKKEVSHELCSREFGLSTKKTNSVDFNSLKKFNQSYRYLTTYMDILYKYAWVILLKQKQSDNIVKVFQSISSESQSYFKVMQEVIPK